MSSRCARDYAHFAWKQWQHERVLFLFFFYAIPTCNPATRDYDEYAWECEVPATHAAILRVLLEREQIDYVELPR